MLRNSPKPKTRVYILQARVTLEERRRWQAALAHAQKRGGGVLRELAMKWADEVWLEEAPVKLAVLPLNAPCRCHCGLTVFLMTMRRRPSNCTGSCRHVGCKTRIHTEAA